MEWYWAFWSRPWMCSVHSSEGCGPTIRHRVDGRRWEWHWCGPMWRFCESSRATTLIGNSFCWFISLLRYRTLGFNTDCRQQFFNFIRCITTTLLCKGCNKSSPQLIWSFTIKEQLQVISDLVITTRRASEFKRWRATLRFTRWLATSSLH